MLYIGASSSLLYTVSRSNNLQLRNGSNILDTHQQLHHHHYRHENLFVIIIHFILKCRIKQNFIEQRIMAVLSTFHYSLHIYTCQPAMLPLFWCLDTGRLRVSDVSSFRSRHVACTGCPRNGHFSSNLILLISNSVFLYPKQTYMLWLAKCLSIYQVFTNLHVILGQGSPKTVASDTIALLLLLLAKRSGGEIFIKSN